MELREYAALRNWGRGDGNFANLCVTLNDAGWSSPEARTDAMLSLALVRSLSNREDNRIDDIVAKNILTMYPANPAVSWPIHASFSGATLMLIAGHISTDDGLRALARVLIDTMCQLNLLDIPA